MHTRYVCTRLVIGIPNELTNLLRNPLERYVFSFVSIHYPEERKCACCHKNEKNVKNSKKSLALWPAMHNYF